MRGLRSEDRYQPFFFLQKATRLIYYLNRAQHVLTRLQRYCQHLSDHPVSLSAQERILAGIVSQIWLTGLENTGANAVVLWCEAKAREVLVLHTVGRDLGKDTVLAFVVEQDDTDLSTEQAGNLARQQLANLADLGASAHHQRDVVQAAQPFDLLLQFKGGFVDCVRKLTDFILAIDRYGFDEPSQSKMSGKILDPTQRSDHSNQNNRAANQRCRQKGKDSARQGTPEYTKLFRCNPNYPDEVTRH